MTRTEKATAKRDEAQGRVGEWEQKASDLGGDLARVEASIGSLTIEVGHQDAARQLAEARAIVEASAAAIPVARRELDAAQRDCWRARAADLRDEAKAAEREAEKVARQSEPLLAKLAEIEGCEFAPLTRGVNGPGGIPMTVSEVPRSARLRNQATSARKHAAALEQAAGSDRRGASFLLASSGVPAPHGLEHVLDGAAPSPSPVVEQPEPVPA